MTRACLSLVFGRGDLGERLRLAAQYHPMVFVVPPLLLYAISGKRPLFGSEKRELAVMDAVCALMLVTYGCGLALHDPVLVHGLAGRPDRACVACPARRGRILQKGGECRWRQMEKITCPHCKNESERKPLILDQH